MNKLYIKNACLIALLAVMSVGAFAQVGVGTLEPDNSAILDLSSSTKGFLPPRMSDTQRDAIPSPATGLIIFNTVTECLNFFDGTGWRESCRSAGGSTGSGAGSGSSGSGSAAWPSGYVHCDPANPTEVVEVTSATNKIWMDRNLGAKQVATNAKDADAFGDLYQWGRFADGHQCRTSTTTTTLANSDTPNHGDFIIYATPMGDEDWLETSNDDLWQGVTGKNNPCPNGFRLPTIAELEAERDVFVPICEAEFLQTNGFSALPGNCDNIEQAFKLSALKFTEAAMRMTDGNLDRTGGHYHSSNTFNLYSIAISFLPDFQDGSSSAATLSSTRAMGLSVRCIKD